MSIFEQYLRVQKELGKISSTEGTTDNLRSVWGEYSSLARRLEIIPDPFQIRVPLSYVVAYLDDWAMEGGAPRKVFESLWEMEELNISAGFNPKDILKRLRAGPPDVGPGMALAHVSQDLSEGSPIRTSHNIRKWSYGPIPPETPHHPLVDAFWRAGLQAFTAYLASFVQEVSSPEWKMTIPSGIFHSGIFSERKDIWVGFVRGDLQGTNTLWVPRTTPPSFRYPRAVMKAVLEALQKEKLWGEET